MEYQLWGSVELLLPTLRYHFLAGFVNSSSAVFMSCERFYALYRPLKHRTNFVNKDIRHCYNKCNLDTGYSCQRDVLCSCKLNFIHSSLLSFYNSIFLLIICFRNISIWRKCLKKRFPLTSKTGEQQKFEHESMDTKLRSEVATIYCIKKFNTLFIANKKNCKNYI